MRRSLIYTLKKKYKIKTTPGVEKRFGTLLKKDKDGLPFGPKLDRVGPIVTAWEKRKVAPSMPKQTPREYLNSKLSLVYKSELLQPCRICGEKSSEVHFCYVITMDRRMWHVNIAVCASHHRLIHRHKLRKEEYKTYKSAVERKYGILAVKIYNKAHNV